MKQGKAKVEDKVVSMFNEELQMGDTVVKYKEM